MDNSKPVGDGKSNPSLDNSTPSASELLRQSVLDAQQEKQNLSHRSQDDSNEYIKAAKVFEEQIQHEIKQLTPEEKKVIGKFGDAIVQEDSHKLANIFDELKNKNQDTVYLLNLELQIRGLGKKYLVTSEYDDLAGQLNRVHIFKINSSGDHREIFTHQC